MTRDTQLLPPPTLISLPPPPPNPDEAHPTIPNDYTRYHPLRTGVRDIRLLRIHPGADTDTLTVSLVRTTLSDTTPPPPYRALSYCWGPLDNLKSISVLFHDDVDADDVNATLSSGEITPVTFQVTTNLHAALASFRRDSPPNVPAYYWIDMLCINQGNLVERSGHVRFMQEVYHQAEEVVVWLGADEELRRSVFASEAYEMALANLALEEVGWKVGGKVLLSDFFQEVRKGVEGDGGFDGWEGKEGEVWVGKARLARREEWERGGSMAGMESAFAALLGEAQAVFGKDPVGNPPREVEAGFKPVIADPAVECLDSDPQPALWDSALEGLYHPYKDSPSALGQAFRNYLARVTARDSELWTWFAAVLPLSLGGSDPDGPVPDRLRPMWRRMTAIAAVPWFNRIWVIQEVASSKRAWIRVGEQEGSWELLRAMIRFCGELAVTDLMFRKIWGLETTVPALWGNLIDYRASKRLNILELLDGVYSFSATDPRDMAIAIYGIASDVDRSLFKPDYRESVGKTYVGFALAVIRSTNSLGMLLRPQAGVREGKPDGLPSWAPDLSRLPRCRTVGFLELEKLPGPGDLSPRIRETADWRVLHVGGAAITKVAAVMTKRSVASFLQTRGGGQDSIAELDHVRVCDLWACVNSVYSKTFSDQGDAAARPLSKLAVTSFCQALIGCWDPQCLEMAVAVWRSQDPQFESSGTSQETREELTRLSDELFGGDLESDAVYPLPVGRVLLAVALRYRALFLSEDGDLGICPASTQPGDVVAVMYGLGGLIALRGVEGAAPKDPRYQVVGECALNSAAYETIWQHWRGGERTSEAVGETVDATQPPVAEWFKLE